MIKFFIPESCPVPSVINALAGNCEAGIEDENGTAQRQDEDRKSQQRAELNLIYEANNFPHQ